MSTNPRLPPAPPRRLPAIFNLLTALAGGARIRLDGDTNARLDEVRAAIGEDGLAEAAEMASAETLRYISGLSGEAEASLEAYRAALTEALPSDTSAADINLLAAQGLLDNARLTDVTEARLEALVASADAGALDAASTAATEAAAGAAEAATQGWGGWIADGLIWFFSNLLEAFYNIAYFVTHLGKVFSWAPHIDQNMGALILEKMDLMRFIYYGASVELFFAVLAIALTVSVIGAFSRSFLWGWVRGLEGWANGLGRLAAWAGLLMVLQQIIIIFVQRIFLANEVTLGLGQALTRDIIWWAEGLKLYNAMIITLCVAYTFVQGGHVRVDLVYAAIGHRAKRVIDMLGSLVFMIPMAVVIWLFGWFFFWRNMITPPTTFTDTLEGLMGKIIAVRWNIEGEGPNPGGFDAYILFKVLLLVFALSVFLQALAFFWRSWLEYREGPESAGKYLDKDTLGDPTAERVAEIH